MTFDAHAELVGMCVYGICTVVGIPHSIALVVAIAVSFPATFPDTMAWPHSRFGDWESYNELHEYAWWPLWLRPFVAPHIWMDSFMHDPATGKWNWKAYLGQAIVWITLMALTIG